MYSLSGKTFAVCGTLDSSASSFLLRYASGRRIWSPSIDCLVLGNEYATRWKYAQALRMSIPTVPISSLLANVPSTLWVEQYKPIQLSEVIGHTTQIQDLQTWLHAWSTSGIRAVFVTGPPGIGKTTVVHLVCRACGYDVVELNASTERSASAIRKWFAEASTSHHIGTRRVVIMDEVDGMSSGDRGGIGELARVIKHCAFPIICIANERTTPRLRPLASCCLDIRFARPNRSTIAKSLMERVVKKQGLSVSAKDLEEICERNGNDIRSILNYLQFSASCSSTKDELQRVDAFSATGRLFGSKGSVDDRMNLVFVDFGLVPLMVAEGYLAAAGKSAGDDADKLRNCIRAADAMCTWDILDTRIRKTNNWSLLPSSVVSIAEAATASKGPAPFQIFPSWLGKHSKRMKHIRQMRQMRTYSLDSRTLLRLRLFQDVRTGPDIVQRLLSYGLTRDDMLDTLVDTVFSGDESSVALDTKTKSAITREWRKRVKPCEVVVHDEKEDVDSEEEELYDVEM